MKSLAFVLAVALTASTALAQQAGQPMNRGANAPRGGPMAMMQKLNLTDDQQAQIRKLHVDFQKKEIQNQAKVRLARLDLSQMMQVDKPDRSALEKAIRDISATETDTKIARMDEMLAIRNVLTPDQQKMWKQQMMNRRGMMRGRTGMMRRQGPGMYGDLMAPPSDVLAPDMALLGDPMDAPEPPMMDDVDLGDIGAE
jgi:periplasmic protein CpxP/Spy